MNKTMGNEDGREQGSADEDGGGRGRVGWRERTGRRRMGTGGCGTRSGGRQGRAGRRTCAKG